MKCDMGGYNMWHLCQYGAVWWDSALKHPLQDGGDPCSYSQHNEHWDHCASECRYSAWISALLSIFQMCNSKQKTMSSAPSLFTINASSQMMCYTLSDKTLCTENEMPLTVSVYYHLTQSLKTGMANVTAVNWSCIPKVLQCGWVFNYIYF